MADRAMRCERAGITQFIEKSDNRRIAQTLAPPGRGPGTPSWNLVNYAIRFSPRGLRYENLLNYWRLWDQVAFNNYSVQRCRIFPSRLSTNWASIDNSFDAPFHYLAGILLPNTYRVIQVIARNQTALNQAMLVCALERYRRARGAYPGTLDALVPGFIQKLPRDLITGEPLKYRRMDDGKFLLYSVGWNAKDDGGLPDKDKEKGDWVWPTTVAE
jgi:hypothetical protein